MTKQLKALLDRLNAAKAAQGIVAQDIVRLNDEDKFDEALALGPKLKAANKEVEDIQDLYTEMLSASADANGQDPARRFIPAGEQPQAHAIAELRASNEYMAEWLTAFRNGVTPKTIAGGQHSSEHFGRLMNALTESGGAPAGEDGGFLNPVDFDNRIIELMREFVDLGNSVNVETVTTLSGWRVIEQFATALPLTKDTTELEVRTVEGEQPKFNRIDYSLSEYKDFLRVGNALLQDTPINLMNYLAKWFSKKLVLTHNALVLTLANAISPTAVTDYKTTLAKIKSTLNKTLDPAFSASASVFVNQDGLEVLDQLDDGVGRPLLQPDPSAPTAFRVKGRPVVVLSNAHWPSLSGPAKARIAIGNGQSYMTIFQRAGFEFATTNIGGDAWRSNSSEVRGIARLDAKEADTGAMALLVVTLP